MCTSRRGDAGYFQVGFFLEEQEQFLSHVSVIGWSLGSKMLSTMRRPRRCAMQCQRKILAGLIIGTVAHFISLPKVQTWVACWPIQLTEPVQISVATLLLPLCGRGGFSELWWRERGTRHCVSSRFLLLQSREKNHQPPVYRIPLLISVRFGPDDIHALGFSGALPLPCGAARRWHPRRNQRLLLLRLNTSVLVEAPSQLLAYHLKLYLLIHYLPVVIFPNTISKCSG